MFIPKQDNKTKWPCVLAITHQTRVPQNTYPVHSETVSRLLYREFSTATSMHWVILRLDFLVFWSHQGVANIYTSCISYYSINNPRTTLSTTCQKHQESFTAFKCKKANNWQLTLSPRLANKRHNTKWMFLDHIIMHIYTEATKSCCAYTHRVVIRQYYLCQSV